MERQVLGKIKYKIASLGLAATLALVGCTATSPANSSEGQSNVPKPVLLPPNPGTTPAAVKDTKDCFSAQIRYKQASFLASIETALPQGEDHSETGCFTITFIRHSQPGYIVGSMDDWLAGRLLIQTTAGIAIDGNTQVPGIVSAVKLTSDPNYRFKTRSDFPGADFTQEHTYTLRWENWNPNQATLDGRSVPFKIENPLNPGAKTL